MAGINIFPEGIPEEEKGVNIFPEGIPARTYRGQIPGKIDPLEGPIKAGLKSVGDAVKENVVATGETIGALATGIPLWAIGKLRGTGELLRGNTEEKARQVEEDIASKGVQPKTEAGKAALGIIGKALDVVTWPAKLAGETAKNLNYPRAGYMIELAGELATFKGLHKVGGKVAKVSKEHATAKAVFNKKMGALTDAQRAEVNKIAEFKGADIVKLEKQSKLTPMEKAYEVQKDIWFSKKDRRVFEADIESRLIKKELKEISKTVTPKSEVIVSASIKLKDGRVFKAQTHHLAMEKMDAAGILIRDWKKVVDDADVFTTSRGRTITRKEAVRLTGERSEDAVDIIGHDISAKIPKKPIKPELYDQAIQIYIDLKNNPSHLDKYYERLNEHQKKVVDLSRNLPEEVKVVADKIADSYKVIGQEAMDATVIRNMLDNYAGRQWDLGPGKSMGPVRKFGTATGHAKARKIGTILQGWAEGYDLKIKGATDNLRAYRQEIVRTIADKQFVDELRKIKDLEGNKLLSTNQLEGYVPVEHPNMTVWEYAGKVENGKVYGKNFFATENGMLYEKRNLYAPKREAKNLNNILGISKLAEVRGIKGLTKFNATTKAWILQSSLFHHMAFLRSFYLPGGFKGKWQTPRKAYKSGIESIEKSDPVLLHGVEKGLTIGLKQDWSESLLRESTHFGRALDKFKPTKVVKDGINKFREGQADFLFGELGAGLKAKAYILEYRHQMKKYPNSNPDIVAKRVANLINDDFGGLNLQRIGRNPTAQHIFRLFALAPDWTESNIRTMVKSMKNMTGDQAELHMYRKFWGGVVVKGIGTTVIANYALSGGNVEEMMDKYRAAWKSGNFNWMKTDITPIYEALGGTSGQSKYFSVVGHFQDPLKFLVHPGKSLKHKQSVVSGIGFEAFSGTDYTGRRRFTTIEELLTEGKTVKWGGSGAVEWDTFPAYALSQIAGTQPIQIQALMAWMAGEQEGFDALSQSIGLRTTSTYNQKKNMKRGLTKLRGIK